LRRKKDAFVMGRNNVFVRMVEQNDLSDIVELMSSMSKTKYSLKQYSSIWTEYINQNFNYSVVALSHQKVIGLGAIVITKRLRGGNLGIVEDIIVHPNYRKQGIGKTIVDSLFDVAKVKSCYQVTLQCKEDVVEFYENCDYEIGGVAMQRFLK
jgi:N-acetylglutamate synthase-like GNAT family acetyltransferase